MGLFWNKNKYDIKLNKNDLNSAVTKLGQNVIKINSLLDIPEGYAVIIGKKGKALDGFGFGENYFSYANLPLICRRYHFDKLIKGGKQTKFNAEIYAVSLGLVGGMFKTYRKVDMGTKAYGYFSAHVMGVYSYKIQKPREFMQSLLNEFDYIKTGEAEKIVASWVDELVVDELEKQNFIIDDVVANNPKITECLKNRIFKLFETAGLELIEFKITKYKLPKKYQQKSDSVMLGECLGEDETQNNECCEEQSEDTGTSINETIEQEKNAQEQPFENNSKNTIDEKNKNGNETTYVPFGNIKFSTGSIEIQKLEKPKEKMYIDLNLEKLYNSSSENKKRCLACGMENNAGFSNCQNCGEKLE